jgi:C1A family cysteine protease
VGVKSVVLSVDGTVVSTLTTAPYNFSWNTTNVADGNHSLSAKAIDASGNSTISTITIAKNTTITTLPPSTIPSNFLLTMPPVGYQGSEGCCVSFAVAYYSRSCEQYYRTGATSYSLSSNIFSPEYVFNQTEAGGCSGASLLNTLSLIVNKGVCTWSSMPFDYTNGCSLQPTANQNSEANNYKIASYSKIYTTDIIAMKTAIINKHPLMMTFYNDNNFNNAGPGYIWKSYDYSNGVGSHAITICGYDDSKHAYKAINSWGTSWGDAGYIWIDYDFLPSVATAVYLMN